MTVGTGRVEAGLATGPRGPVGQVADLFRFRWSTLPGAGKVGLAVAGSLALLLGPLAFGLGVWAGPDLSVDVRTQASELLPASLVLVAVGIVVAAIASGGGRELVPRQQLVAYPVTPMAEHLTMLAMTPANLAWWIQSLGLFLVAGVATAVRVPEGGSAVLPGLMMFALCAAWLAAATTLAQWLAWVLDVARLLPGGVWIVRAGMLLAVLVAVRSMNATTLTKVLDWQPPRTLTDRALLVVEGQWLAGAVIVTVLVAVSVLAVIVGSWTYSVVARRPARAQVSGETRMVRSAGLPEVAAFASDVRAWRRQDWALMRRSLPVRRGLLVLGVVPALGGALSRTGINDLPLMTAVVSAASTLVLGVNAFALDAEGAPWRESLPVEPRVWLTARGWVIAETAVAMSIVATAASASGARGQVSLAAVLACLMAVPTMTAQVVARSLRWSVHRPSRAELRTSRDSPTGPGRLVLYSIQLMGATMFVGVLLGAAARSGHWWAPVIVCLPSLVLSARRIRLTAQAFDSPDIRAAMVQAVSRG